MCVSPYIAVKLDGSKVAVPCGHCIDCRKDWQRDWVFRLSQEVKRAVCPIFLTLTYNDEHLPMGDLDLASDVPFPEVEVAQSVLVKSDLQKFFKRLRKNGKESLKDMRYFAIGEYGSKKNRAHYHAVIIAPNITCVGEFNQVLDKSWRDSDGELIGFYFAKYCTPKQLHYVCKYLNKLDERPHLVPPFRLMSRGIGLNYLTDRIIQYYLTSFSRTCKSGKYDIRLPRYYRQKLDELSENNYMLKRSGLKYSDMLEEIYFPEGSKYWFFKDFCDNFDSYYEQAITHIVKYDGEEFVLHLGSPSRQELFQRYVRSNKYLLDLVYESDRILSECVICNRLKGVQPVTPFDSDEIISIINT